MILYDEEVFDVTQNHLLSKFKMKNAVEYCEMVSYGETIIENTTAKFNTKDIQSVTLNLLNGQVHIIY